MADTRTHMYSGDHVTGQGDSETTRDTTPLLPGPLSSRPAPSPPLQTSSWTSDPMTMAGCDLRVRHASWCPGGVVPTCPQPGYQHGKLSSHGPGDQKSEIQGTPGLAPSGSSGGGSDPASLLFLLLAPGPLGILRLVAASPVSASVFTWHPPSCAYASVAVFQGHQSLGEGPLQSRVTVTLSKLACACKDPVSK